LKKKKQKTFSSCDWGTMRELAGIVEAAAK
jgi:hypothetical protein